MVDRERGRVLSSEPTPKEKRLAQENERAQKEARASQASWSEEQMQRRQWADGWHLTRMEGLNAFRKLVPLSVWAAFLLVLFFAVTFVIHMFIPYFGWLNDEQQERIFSGYASVAKVGFPIAIALVTGKSLRGVFYPPKRDTESDD